MVANNTKKIAVVLKLIWARNNRYNG